MLRVIGTEAELSGSKADSGEYLNLLEKEDIMEVA